MSDRVITDAENTYHTLGLIGELLSVAHFRVDDMPAVSLALNYITNERTKYESARTEEEGKENQAEADSADLGSVDTDNVPEAN